MRYSTITLFVLTVSAVQALPGGSSSTGSTNSYGTPGLNDYAQAAGMVYFGSAAEIPGEEQTDEAYLAIFNNTHNFGQTTPTNYMKWEYTEPEPGVFNYSGCDALLNIAEANGQLVRCHNLVWYNQLPDWVTTGNWTNATLIPVLERHINNLVEHWGKRCYAWDVLNEAINDNGTLRSDVWLDTIGPDYIPIVFDFAEKAVNKVGGGIKLYYNDYNIEYLGVKSDTALEIVKTIQSRGIRIDGVGLQSHFIVGDTPSRANQTANMESFTALGVEVAQTELDIRFSELPYNASGLEVQKQNYIDSVGACFDVEGCIGITLWDFTDKYSWIPDTFKGAGGACPWSANLTIKPAYYGCIDGLTGKQSHYNTTSPSSSSMMAKLF